MNPAGQSALTPEQQARLDSLANMAHEKLESAAQSSANQAFNLGCSVGLLPAALIVGLSFLITRGSWIAALITALLMGIALLGLASLAANIARSNSIDRAYRQEVLPQIEANLHELDINRTDFDCWADQNLPAGASLRKYLSNSASPPDATGPLPQNKDQAS